MTLNLINPEDPTITDMALAMIDRSLEITRKPIDRTSPSWAIADQYAQATWHAHSIAADYETAAIDAGSDAYRVAWYWANVRAQLDIYASSYTDPRDR